MATNASIACVGLTGVVHQIYLHWDGDSAGEILKYHYNTIEKALELINGGDLSSIGVNISPEPEQLHTFEKPAKDVCVFYGRDRGEAISKNIYEDFEVYRLTAPIYEVNYLFVDGCWRVSTAETINNFRLL